MSLGSDLLTTRPLVEFADVTLADDDTNLIYELITSIHEAAG